MLRMLRLRLRMGDRLCEWIWEWMARAQMMHRILGRCICCTVLIICVRYFVPAQHSSFPHPFPSHARDQYRVCRVSPAPQTPRSNLQLQKCMRERRWWTGMGSFIRVGIVRGCGRGWVVGCEEKRWNGEGGREKDMKLSNRLHGTICCSYSAKKKSRVGYTIPTMSYKLRCADSQSSQPTIR